MSSGCRQQDSTRPDLSNGLNPGWSLLKEMKRGHLKAVRSGELGDVGRQFFRPGIRESSEVLCSQVTRSQGQHQGANSPYEQTKTCANVLIRKRRISNTTRRTFDGLIRGLGASLMTRTWMSFLGVWEGYVLSGTVRPQRTAGEERRIRPVQWVGLSTELKPKVFDRGNGESRKTVVFFGAGVSIGATPDEGLLDSLVDGI